MRTYEFSPEEFAKLSFLLGELVHFHHAAERSIEELQSFSKRIYPLLKDVNYQVVGSKIDKAHYDTLSEHDSLDRLSADQAIEALTQIFKQ